MPNITLPDGSVRSFEQPVTVAEVAASIGAGLAKAALAGKVDGRVVDLSHRIEADTQLAIVTDKSAEGLEVIRHSTAHLLAHAVKELFPEAQVTIGPVIENGFYYDFAYKRPFTPEDLEKIEKRMAELARREIPVSREVWARDEAVAFFQGQGEHYKAEIIASIPQADDVSLYRQGDFIDLCRGPHVPSTGKLKVFKLTKVAGAYWRGNSKNEMLQRIYGTAWAKKEELDGYLHMLEEAEKRDHRKLGQLLGLFHFQEEAPGAVFWHPKGWRLFQSLINYMRARQEEAGYVEVNTPDVMDRALWETSGHWQNYRQNMFTTQTEDERVFALKPMNCPGAVSMYAQGLKSYRDLPLRMAEFGKVHRYEPSGALHGLLRVRHFTQDDAHIFCTEDQLEKELQGCLELVRIIFGTLGMDSYRVRVGLRDPDSSKYAGARENWDRAEKACRDAARTLGVPFSEEPGEAAFYGPKIDFVVKDVIGREWQLGTVQVDYNLPERFELNYTGSDNQLHRPVMIHRAPFGSMERFCGVLIEHFAGAFPAWLAPEQVRVLPVSEKSDSYARKVFAALRGASVRATLDQSSDRLQAKIREAAEMKIPYLLVVGPRDEEAGTVSVRARGITKDLGALELFSFVEAIGEEIRSRGRTTVLERFELPAGT